MMDDSFNQYPDYDAIATELQADYCEEVHGASAPHHARFELRKDEDTGRLYWYGAEDGWKDATEIGEDGVLTLDGQHFAVGSVLTLTELVNACLS